MLEGAQSSALWCLPYDTDTVFKPFLKISFSDYLNHLISNQHFPAYQAAVAKQINDRGQWNEKCWHLVQYFEFLNQSFDVDVWDDRITFIEDNHLRSIMGFFRLWIDTERLYLLNFLKLDSNEFQENRIFMSLFRTLLFLNNLFNEYVTSDFDPQFLRHFISKSVVHLQELNTFVTKEASIIIEAIISLFENLEKKERILIELGTLQGLKKSAINKVAKERETIKDVENRLQNSAHYKWSLDQETRLIKIAKSDIIEEFTEKIKDMYDPIFVIERDYDIDFYALTQQNEALREQGRKKIVANYKQEVKGVSSKDQNIYRTLEVNKNNPYSFKNYQMYGQAVKVDMNDREKYEKQKITEVASVLENDRSRIFYDDSYLKAMEEANGKIGQVTAKDVNTSNKSQAKKEDFKHHDQNTRIFNLKWNHDPNARKTLNPSAVSQVKDYDNNLLFKSPLEEQILSSRKNNLDKLKEHYETSSYTVALLEQMAEQIFPEQHTSSQGATLFVNKTPQTLDIKNYRLLNKNKFDFMRKVIGFMTAQKKIQKIIGQKPVPEFYPRNYSDVKQLAYNPEITHEKVRYAMGRSERHPPVYPF